MKKIFLLSACLFCLCCGKDNSHRLARPTVQACNTTEAIVMQDIQGAYLQLPNNSFDFGEINRIRFPELIVDVELNNIGTRPLVIFKADVSCGCITVEYPKEPIPPDSSDVLKVKVDLRAQDGVFNKSIFIKSNACNDVVLIHITGAVRR